MASRAQSITLTYTAWDTVNQVGKTGDVANHTLRWVKDGTASAPSNSASEVDSTNAPGLYKITMTTSEATCDFGVLAGKSSTSGVSIIPIAVAFENLPTAAPAASGGLPTVDASNAVKVQSGTGANQISLSSGLVSVSALGAGVITTASIADGAFTAAKFGSSFITASSLASDTLTAAKIAADVSAEIADAVWDEATSGHTSAGTFGEWYQPLRQNTAQAGGASTVTLDASASATNDIYKNQAIHILSGTGAGQTRIITAYNGTTKVATVNTAWATNPASDSVFQVLANGEDGSISPAGIADAVWDEARADHVTAGSFGQGVASVQGNVTGSVASVTGAVGSVTGNVTGSVGSLAAQAKADVNAEVLDVLVTDTFAEPSAPPNATSSIKDKINWVFVGARNKQTQTATTSTIRNAADAGNIAQATVSDDGTTATRGRWA
jgi:hypothetical protein